MTEKEIDLRRLHPVDRHGAVFRNFEELNSGNALILLVDHDPAPLYRQFETRWPYSFSWEYRERGPGLWKVRIEKNPEAQGELPNQKGGCCGCCGG